MIDENARKIYDKLRHGVDFGRRKLDDMLKEPVPLALVRSIKSAAAEDTDRPAQQPPAVQARRRAVAEALAAALILFVVGGGIGYFIGNAPDTDDTSAVAAATQINTE